MEFFEEEREAESDRAARRHSARLILVILGVVVVLGLVVFLHSSGVRPTHGG